MILPGNLHGRPVPLPFARSSPRFSKAPDHGDADRRHTYITGTALGILRNIPQFSIKVEAQLHYHPHQSATTYFTKTFRVIHHVSCEVVFFVTFGISVFRHKAALHKIIWTAFYAELEYQISET